MLTNYYLHIPISNLYQPNFTPTIITNYTYHTLEELRQSGAEFNSSSIETQGRRHRGRGGRGRRGRRGHQHASNISAERNSSYSNPNTEPSMMRRR